MTAAHSARVATTASLREAVRISGLDESQVAMLMAAGRLDRPWGRNARLTYRTLIQLYLHGKLSKLGVGEADLDEGPSAVRAVCLVDYHLMAHVEDLAEARYGRVAQPPRSGPDAEPAHRYLVVDGRRTFRCRDLAAAEALRDQSPPDSPTFVVVDLRAAAVEFLDRLGRPPVQFVEDCRPPAAATSGPSGDCKGSGSSA